MPRAKPGPDLFDPPLGARIAGIDEVGRGPLAGPVLAAAVVLERRQLSRALRSEIDDSKALTAAERTRLAGAIVRCARIGVGAASAPEIDRHNILQAGFIAMRRALAALGAPPDVALVDGNRAPALPCAVRTVVGGDGLSLSIAAASIIAKVTRDRLMRALAPRYPGYGWDTNVGYGTVEHRAALERLGVTPHHRKTFEPVLKILSRAESGLPKCSLSD
jgi:ribonuclease HII